MYHKALRQIAQLSAQHVHGIADDDVAAVKFLAVNLGKSKDFGFWVVLAEFNQEL